MRVIGSGLTFRPLVLFAMGALAAACSGDEVSGADRRWAERATLEIARVNDVIALRMVPYLAGETTSDGTEPQWAPVHDACTELTALVPGIDQVASEAPPRFEGTGETLRTYANQIATFASRCEMATAAKDIAGWQSLAALDAGTLGA